MKRSKVSEERIIYALRQVESNTSIGDLCRQLDCRSRRPRFIASSRKGCSQPA